MEPVSIVIPSWNGKDLLAKFLPSVIAACQHYQGQSEIIVVDNGSIDGTEEFIKSHFPQIQLIRCNINLGFPRGCNLGIKKSKHEIIILLNNDVRVEKDFIVPILHHFENERVFAVRIAVKKSESDNADLFSYRLGGEFKFGFIYTPAKMAPKEEPPTGIIFAFTASGGYSAISKKKFIQLGGFDELFSPLYAEDLDICYRAWKRGWQIDYEPKSVVCHQPGTTTFRSWQRRHIEILSVRNKFILVWKNITDRKLFLQHLLFIPLRLFRSVYRLKFNTFFSLVSALMLLPRIWSKRQIERRLAVLTDKEVFDIFKVYMSLPDFTR